MIRSALLLVMTMATLAGAVERPEVPKQLSLSQALTIALSNSTVIRTAMARLQETSGLYAQARSVLLPQLELNAHQSYLTINLRGLGIEIPGISSETKTGPFGSMDARISLKQDLLNIANLQAWKSSRSRQQASRLLVDNAREVVALNVIAAYLDALRAKESRDTLMEQTGLASDLYNLTQDRVRQGVSAPLEAIRAQQQVNSLEQQRQEAEQSYMGAKLALANLLQARITADYDVEDNAAYGADGATMDRELTRDRLAFAARLSFGAGRRQSGRVADPVDSSLPDTDRYHDLQRRTERDLAGKQSEHVQADGRARRSHLHLGTHSRTTGAGGRRVARSPNGSGPTPLPD